MPQEYRPPGLAPLLAEHISAPHPPQTRTVSLRLGDLVGTWSPHKCPQPSSLSVLDFTDVEGGRGQI